MKVVQGLIRIQYAHMDLVDDGESLEDQFLRDCPLVTQRRIGDYLSQQVRDGVVTKGMLDVSALVGLDQLHQKVLRRIQQELIWSKERQ